MDTHIRQIQVQGYAEKERDKKRLHLIICVLELDRFGFIKFTDRTRDDDERKNDVKDGLC